MTFKEEKNPKSWPDLIMDGIASAMNATGNDAEMRDLQPACSMYVKLHYTNTQLQFVGQQFPALVASLRN